MAASKGSAMCSMMAAYRVIAGHVDLVRKINHHVFPRLLNATAVNQRNAFFSERILGVRTYLSSSYECKDAWQARLQSSLFEKLNMVDYFNELDKKFIHKKKVGAVDIDMFANNIREKEQLEELSSLLYRFRRTRFTVNTFESTHHAVVRSFLEFHQYDALMEILNKTAEYGIFPDHYTYNLLMDEFLKQKRYKDAADVAKLMMLQEDFSNPIGKRLALCAAHLHRINPEPAAAEPEGGDKQEEDDGEEVLVRVPYLRNPYFDDHFDITNPRHLLGKTLYMVGKEFDDPVGRTYQLIGLGLHEKWEKARKLLEKFLDSSEKPVIVEEGAATFLESLNASGSEESPVPEKTALLESIEKLRNQQKMSSDDLNAMVMAKLEEIKDLESADIEAQKKLYVEWEAQRLEGLKLQIEEFLHQEKAKEIEAKKAELEEKEKLLFFFENWDKHEMELEEAEKLIKEMEPVLADAAYIPPEISRHMSKQLKTK